MIIGVTGSLATGKTTVSKFLKKYLAGYLIDADEIARSLLVKGEVCYKEVVKEFGKDILDNTGFIDRKKLAKKAFQNSQEIDKLNSIVHPYVLKNIREKIEDKGSDGSSVIIVDAPLLIESVFNKECDIVIVLISSLSEQLDRAMKSLGIDTKDALARIKLQMSLAEKARYADIIIDNSKDLKELEVECKKIASEIVKD
ncbi:MAG: dephospho-CoA kinase [Candidatus Omnitrophota bacterium]